MAVAAASSVVRRAASRGGRLIARAFASGVGGGGGEKAKRVLVPVAAGTEPIEAATTADVLNRAGARVTVATADPPGDDGLLVHAAYGVKLVADGRVADLQGEPFDLIALPGGMPGSVGLRDCKALEKMVKTHAENGALYGAICAAPAVTLAYWGMLKGLKATCYPSYMEKFTAEVIPVDSRVVVDRNAVTSQGPGTSVEFALALVEKLYGKEKMEEVAGPLIVPAPVRVGEDELPPSWDPIPSPLVNMLGRGSPRLNMLGRGSPRFNMLLSKGAQKKKSPIATASKTHGGSPKGKTRANWNSMLEKTLVDLLHEHNTPEYKGNNGWTPDAWNKIAKEFQERERYAGFSKVQIQEKEKELKRDYRMLKDARKQSGVSWDERRCMIQADPLIWDNIIKSFPRAKKFRNKSFPLFEALGELHDGNTAEGTYNFTSTQPNGPDLTQIGTGDVPINVEDHEDVGDPLADHRQNEAEDRVYEVEGVDVNADRQDERPKRTGDVPRNGEEKGPKRQKKSSNIEVLMERYLDFRSKQAEDEATQLAREREARGGDDFSIKNCIAVLNTLEVTKEEKVKAYKVFKDPDNRQIFLSACNDDREAALMWLRDEMA